MAGPGAPTINPEPQGVRHFNACMDNNDSVSLYSTYTADGLKLLVEYAQTLKVWPGTFNPYIPELAAAKNKTFTVGARQSANVGLIK